MSAEWIKYGKTWEQFCEARLNKPGTQIDLQCRNDLTKHKLYLIGDVNELGGCCDDCMVFHEDQTIIRYRVLEIPDGS